MAEDGGRAHHMPLPTHLHTNSNENTQAGGVPENQFRNKAAAAAAAEEKAAAEEAAAGQRRLAALRAELLALPTGRNTQDQELGTPNLPENQVSFFIVLFRR